MRFDDAAIAELTKIAWEGFWRAASGASDDALDALADRVAHAPPETPRRLNMRASVDQARVDLLLGVDTDRSLTRLGDLGRIHDSIGRMCLQRGVQEALQLKARWWALVRGE